MVLIPKDGTMRAEKFRPVTILSRVRIMFEKIVHRRKGPHIKINEFQGGFKKGRHCHH